MPPNHSRPTHSRRAVAGLIGAAVLCAAGGCGGARPSSTFREANATSPTSPSPRHTVGSTTAGPSRSGSASGESRGSAAPLTSPRGAATGATDEAALGALLDRIAARAVESFGGTAGIAVAATGGGERASGGSWTSGAAWSTAKVPVAMAALRVHPGPGQTQEWAARAIRLSDNSAAEALWSSLGDSRAAGAATEEAIRALGDHVTRVQWQRVRPPYTAFGQTQWSLRDQAVAAAGLPCATDAAPVLALMGQIDPAQAFGLGHVPGARFKGGWGPDVSGRYLVRQFGVLTVSSGTLGVALAAEPASGSFDSGTAALSLMAQELAPRLDALPAGDCR